MMAADELSGGNKSLVPVVVKAGFCGFVNGETDSTVHNNKLTLWS